MAASWNCRASIRPLHMAVNAQGCAGVAIVVAHLHPLQPGSYIPAYILLVGITFIVHAPGRTAEPQLVERGQYHPACHKDEALPLLVWQWRNSLPPDAPATVPNLFSVPAPQSRHASLPPWPKWVVFPIPNASPSGCAERRHVRRVRSGRDARARRDHTLGSRSTCCVAVSY